MAATNGAEIGPAARRRSAASWLALLFFGGEILRGFSTALTIGIVIGTYSSIYIASALALDVPAPPMVLLFGAAAAAMFARRRNAQKKKKAAAA